MDVFPFLRRAGDLYHLLDHVVQQIRLLRVRGFIIHFLAVPAADNQPGALQLLQMVGDCRAAHIHKGGNIGHTFLAVAQEPEDPDPASVTELFENI